ncbi:hypothetical protein [Eubacterium sp.]|uniref:hypothetical protein n=1 Tax=Eubacterium sp. TaxID=142586 RepID=UPI0025E97349|nr:hypothetical protein [Eubacterium sp.]MCR5630060.1 hypothetical protein [Eubacterium sp.]
MKKKEIIKKAGIIIAASACVATFIIVGFYKPLKKIDINNMSADVFVYDKNICEVSDEYKNIKKFDKDTLFLKDIDVKNTSDEYATIVIPGVSTDGELGYGNSSNTNDTTEKFIKQISADNLKYEGFIDRGYLHTAIQKDVDLKKLSVIRVKSDYLFRGFSLDVKKNSDGEGYTLYVKNPRTSIFNNSADNKEFLVDIETCMITKVIAVTGSDEKVIYEKKDVKSKRREQA